MTEIRFYHLLRRTLEDALPRMLEMSLERGWRAVVMAGSPERVEALNQHLWTFRKDSFLPHGTASEGEAERQPVWLTDRDENPNGASVLFLTDGAESAALAGYTRVCELFDGNDGGAVAAARARWKRYKEAGHELSYWQQTARGGWERKA
jgi:DNA polymerase III subunit chi